MCLYTLTHTLVLTVPLITLGPLPPITNDQETRDFFTAVMHSTSYTLLEHLYIQDCLLTAYRKGTWG